MSEFGNPVIKLGDKKYELRCDTSALDRIEDIYDTGFALALSTMIQELESQSIRMKRLRQIICALIYVKDETERPTEESIKEFMDLTNLRDLIAPLGEAVHGALPKSEEGAAADDVAAEDPTAVSA